MATYIEGSTDFIPQLQPFQPDLNFYSGVLSTKQQQYDQGLQKLNSIYGSALNSPMSRQDNIERRDAYFKTITQQIQKVAKLDLSVDQNIETAKTLFDPILNDKNIVNDMVFTKQLQNAYGNAEQYRNCVDPDKCGGEFWQDGVKALDYASEEFKNASPDDAMRHRAPKYTPAINVTKKAIKAAKDAGFNVSYDHVEGRYMVTDTNGQVLLGEKGDGVLPQFLYGMFGNDGAVQNMYSTQAYVQRKDYAKQNAAKFGGDENAAESDYLNKVIAQTVPKLEASKKDLTNLREQLSTDSKAIELLAKNNGGVIKGDGVEEAYAQLQGLLENTKASEQYHENVSNLITSAPNLNDIKQLRNRADNIVANGLFMTTIQSAAYDYAMGTSKREMKADPYALAAYNNSLDISKGIALQNHELTIWEEKERRKGIVAENALKNALGSGAASGVNQIFEQKGITSQKLADVGLSPNVRTWTKDDILKAQTLGLNESDIGEVRKVQNAVVVENEADNYTRNSRLLIQSANNLTQSAGSYLNDSFNNMVKQYQNPPGKNTEEKNIYRTKILNNATSILAGTGISPESILAGTVKPDIFLKEPARFSKSVARATSLQEKDLASNIITGQWSPDAYAKYQLSKQVAEGFYATRKDDNRKALEEMKASVMVEHKDTLVTDNPNDYKKGILQNTKAIALVSAIADEDGLVTRDQALARYLKATANVYRDTPARYSKEIGNVPGVSALAQAEHDFNSNFERKQNEYREKTTDWQSKAASRDIGGATASGSFVNFTVSGDKPLAPSYNQFERLANEIPNVALATYAGGPTNGFETSGTTATRLFEAVKSGDTKGLDFTYSLEHRQAGLIPGTSDKVGTQTVLNVNVSEATARKLHPELKKDADVTPFKNFSVTIPVGAGSSTADQFITKTTLSPTEIYMLNNKATLNQTLPNLGSYNITRENKDLVFTGNFYAFNPWLQEIGTKDFEPIQLGEISPEKAIEIGNSLLVQAGAFTNNAKRSFLNNTASDARTGK